MKKIVKKLISNYRDDNTIKHEKNYKILFEHIKLNEAAYFRLFENDSIHVWVYFIVRDVYIQ